MYLIHRHECIFDLSKVRYVNAVQPVKKHFYIIYFIITNKKRTTLESIILLASETDTDFKFKHTRWELFFFFKFIARFVLRICYDCIHTRLVLLYNAIIIYIFFYSDGNEMSTHPLINYARSTALQIMWMNDDWERRGWWAYMWKGSF